MKSVMGLPRGLVLLPGLDRDIDARSWDAIAAGAQTHPQFGLARLLGSLGVAREDIADLEACETNGAGARRALVTEVFRPAETSDVWIDRRAELDEKGLANLAIAVCATAQEEALTIAFALRDAIENGQETAALVTPDRNLARRVAAELTRWGLSIDDSAGQPLSATPAGSFLRLVCETVAEDFAPAPLLALLHHERFSAPGEEDLPRARSALEALALRGRARTPASPGCECGWRPLPRGTGSATGCSASPLKGGWSRRGHWPPTWKRR